MESCSRSPAPEALLEESAWVRDLARRLIRDPHAAEDATQEAWLAVVERRMGDARAPRSWFARALRNFARMRGRSETARSGRERAVARHEAGVEDPSELVARAELQQRVVAAVLRLAEPYRSTVLARSWRGMTIEELARSRGVPASTVRGWHVHALAQLRTELDREFGARATWAIALADLAGAGTAGSLSAAGLGSGGVVMAMGMKWFLGAGAAAVLAALFVWNERGDSARGARETRADAHDEEAELEAARLVVPPAGDEASSARAGAERAALAGAPAIVGWVRTPQAGLPVRGAELVRFERDGTGRREDVLAVSDEAGRLELAGCPVFEWYLTVRAEGFLERRLASTDFAPRAGEEFTVTLAPLGALDVRVVDEEGEPIPDLSLSCRAFVNIGSPFQGGNRDVLASAQSDARGHASFAGLPCGVPVGVGAFDWAHTTTIPEGERHASIELVQPRPGAAAGSVLDAAGGPAAGVQIVLDWDGRVFAQPNLRTDEGGRYRFEDVPPREVRVVASAPGAEPRSGTVPRGGLLELEPIVLPALVAFEGRVRSRFAFRPLTFTLELFRDGAPLCAPVWADAEGRFRAELVPGPVWLRVSQHSAFRGKDGVVHSLSQLGEVLRTQAEAPASGLELWIDSGLGTVACALPASLAATDRPPEVDLHYYVSSGRGEDLLETGQGFLWQEYGLAREGEGFRSQAIRPGSYAMIFDVPGHGTAWIPEVRIEPDRVTDVGELVLESAAIRGRVATPSGQPVSGAALSLERTWAEGVQTTSDARGDFDLASLAPGLYWLYGFASDGSRALAVVTLRAGEEREITLTLEPPAALSARVLRAGEPVSGASVRLRSQRHGQATTTPGTTDDEGVARFERLEPGHYELEVERVQRAIELAAGDEREITLVLDVATFETWILAPDGSPADVAAAELVVHDPDGPHAGELHQAEVLERGHLRVAHVPAPAVLVARVAGEKGTWDAALDLDLRREPPLFVLLPSGTLELALDRDAAGGPPPEIELAGFPGLTLSAPRRLAVLRECTATGWRYHGIPPAAILLVRGTDEHGDALVRTLLPAGEARRLRWE